VEATTAFWSLILFATFAAAIVFVMSQLVSENHEKLEHCISLVPCSSHPGFLSHSNRHLPSLGWNFVDDFSEEWTCFLILMPLWFASIGSCVKMCSSDEEFTTPIEDNSCVIFLSSFGRLKLVAFVMNRVILHVRPRQPQR